VNSNDLTITSFLYNPTVAASAWVDRILGPKAVFFDKSPQNFWASSDKPLSKEEMNLRSTLFQNKMNLPPSALWPSCSFEMLGYIRLGVTEEFQLGPRISPVTGTAAISDRKQVNWPCYYRSLYENWREETEYSEPNYWATVFYCTAPNITDCQQFHEKYIIQGSDQPIASFQLKIPLKSGATIQTDFTAKIISKKEAVSHAVTEIKEKSFSLPLAVCVAIPYTSSDSGKEAGNGAMLYEWVRYHRALGIKVIVYDRNGANWKHIFNSKYGKARYQEQRRQHRTSNNNSNNGGSNYGKLKKLELVYHPYTIRGLLESEKRNIRYDNTERFSANTSTEDPAFRSRFETQGFDKVLTLTQCRFEAKALYGIDNVIVADFDEFLYCPIGGRTASEQAAYLRWFLLSHKMQGVEQLELPQRYVGNRTDSPRDCVIQHAQSGKSIFDCFAAFRFYNGGHSVKSIHLGHQCPLTGYHHACSGSDDPPRAYDCMCHSHAIPQNNLKPYEHVEGYECAMVHVSTLIDNYIVKYYEFTDKERSELLVETSELKEIAEAIY
jgi:hypothetical protein